MSTDPSAEVFARAPLVRFSVYSHIQAEYLRATSAEILSVLDKMFKGGNAVGGHEFNRAYGLFWLWVLGAYEVTRTMSQYKAGFSKRAAVEIQTFKKQIEKVRIPFAKLEFPSKWNEPIAIDGEASVAGFDFELRDLLFEIKGNKHTARSLIDGFDKMLGSIQSDDVLCDLRQVNRWQTLWSKLGKPRYDGAAWYRRLLAAYNEPQRHYHNWQHLEECLGELAQYWNLAKRPALVAAAVWFHDAVYDPKSATNEEDSAALAVECLGGAGVAERDVAAVRALILCTKTHETAGVPDAALLLDIDLAILGQPGERFWEYEVAIRQEYAWVPEETFCTKRAEILRKFLVRPVIYQTPAFRTRYETTARANLKAAIERLI